MTDPTAVVCVAVHPVGVPGTVMFEIVDLGPERLSDAEMVWTLRQAYYKVAGVSPRPIEPGMDDDEVTMAKLAYAAYGESTGNKNYQGLPMPDWNDLGAPIQGAWLAAVGAVADFLEG